MRIRHRAGVFWWRANDAKPIARTCSCVLSGHAYRAVDRTPSGFIGQAPLPPRQPFSPKICWGGDIAAIVVNHDRRCALDETDVEQRSHSMCDYSLMHGTELAFNSEIAVYGACGPTQYKTAIFRQVNREQPHMHHDALELPDGQMLLLTFLCEGQEATVLQLPAKPTTQDEAQAQERVAVAG